MTSTTTQPPTGRTTEPTGGANPREVALGRGVPLTRTVHAELRKMVDTRAGRWLIIAMSALSVVVVGTVLIWGDAEDTTFESLLSLTTIPLVILLPVLGIMAATSEWSQRTGLVTFTLEPRRGRVILAKVLAAIVLGLVVIAAAFAAAALANVVGIATSDRPASWSLTAATTSGLLLALLIYVIQGLGFGFVFLNTPLAIVASLVLPTAWSIAGGLFSGLRSASTWLDLNTVTAPLLEGTMHAEDWAHLGTAAAVWVGIPLAVGSWRVMTREVK